MSKRELDTFDLLSLPTEIIIFIANKLSVHDINHLRCCCQLLCAMLAKSYAETAANQFFRSIYQSTTPTNENQHVMCTKNNNHILVKYLSAKEVQISVAVSFKGVFLWNVKYNDPEICRLFVHGLSLRKPLVLDDDPDTIYQLLVNYDEVRDLFSNMVTFIKNLSIPLPRLGTEYCYPVHFSVIYDVRTNEINTIYFGDRYEVPDFSPLETPWQDTFTKGSFKLGVHDFVWGDQFAIVKMLCTIFKFPFSFVSK